MTSQNLSKYPLIQHRVFDFQFLLTLILLQKLVYDEYLRYLLNQDKKADLLTLVRFRKNDLS